MKFYIFHAMDMTEYSHRRWGCTFQFSEWEGDDRHWMFTKEVL